MFEEKPKYVVSTAIKHENEADYEKKKSRKLCIKNLSAVISRKNQGGILPANNFAVL